MLVRCLSRYEDSITTAYTWFATSCFQVGEIMCAHNRPAHYVQRGGSWRHLHCQRQACKFACCTGLSQVGWDGSRIVGHFFSNLVIEKTKPTMLYSFHGTAPACSFHRRKLAVGLLRNASLFGSRLSRQQLSRCVLSEVTSLWGHHSCFAPSVIASRRSSPDANLARAATTWEVCPDTDSMVQCVQCLATHFAQVGLNQIAHTPRSDSSSTMR